MLFNGADNKSYQPGMSVARLEIIAYRRMSAGSEVRVSLRESIWILAEDFCENPLNPFFSLKFRASLHGEISSRILNYITKYHYVIVSGW